MYSSQQRLEIYKNLLRIFIENENGLLFFCTTLSRIPDHGIHGQKGIKLYLPELNSCKDKAGSAWYQSVYDSDCDADYDRNAKRWLIRVLAIIYCIETLTNKKII